LDNSGDWKDQFIKDLQALVKDGNRAVLARLHRGLGKDFGTVPDRDGWVIRHLPPFIVDNDFRLRDCCLLSSLFASHENDHAVQGNLGTAFRHLAAQTNSESVEKRFVSLLNCDREDLPDHLRHAVSLLRSREIPVNWRQMLDDLAYWDSDYRSVQRKWSKEFWRAPATASGAAKAHIE
jgi:CRISPR system Cascade subunit CasB